MCFDTFRKSLFWTHYPWSTCNGSECSVILWQVIKPVYWDPIVDGSFIAVPIHEKDGHFYVKEHQTRGSSEVTGQTSQPHLGPEFLSKWDHNIVLGLLVCITAQLVFRHWKQNDETFNWYNLKIIPHYASKLIMWASSYRPLLLGSFKVWSFKMHWHVRTVLPKVV